MLIRVNLSETLDRIKVRPLPRFYCVKPFPPLLGEGQT
jgi:hypothetical protein